ncbi:MAG: hypothetical protein WBQ38_09215 [Ignavibacteria bacterium]|nr:hypothetical protein [Ignavibacteria bacterium]MBK9405130.1 hypothetical protein [Ignavibacteria bacterium]
MNIADLFFKSQTYDRDTIKKIFLIIAVSWLPLLIISFFSGTMLSADSKIKIPFLYDYLTNARLLISFPVIFLSISIINNLISKSFDQFVSAEIVRTEDLRKFKQISDTYYKLKDSKISNIIIFFLSYLWIYFFWRNYEDISGLNSWKLISSGNEGVQLAGYWYYIVSIPVVQIFMFKMIWTFLLWSSSLYRIAKLNLNISSSSPDGAGGLAFLGYTQIFFGLLGFAQNVTFSAGIADKIVYNNESFMDYRFNIILGIISVSLIYIVPLLFFTKHLLNAKLVTLFEYSKLGLNYGTSFENKWIKKNMPDNSEPLLGNADIQSLADMSNSVKMVQDQLIIPLRISTFIAFFVVLIIPYLPLLLLRFTSEEILQGILNFFV